ncbi:MAG TPA: NAD(P)-dependent oxidoreductase, partial [Nitrospira sp.]
AIRSVVLASPCEAVVRGKTLIQMGTIGAEDSRTLHTMLARRGADYFEAPVLGSRAEAKAGTLLVMVGSTETQFTKWRPLFRLLGRTPRRIGPVGTASTLKLALNQLIAAEMGAFALSVGFIQRSHVSMDVFMDILRGSALFAPTFEKKLPRLMKRHYQDPNFSTAHLLKDVNLFIRSAKPLKVRFEALEKVGRLLREAINHGLHASDYSALYEIINPPVSHEHR